MPKHIDLLANRMKKYESQTDISLMSYLPVYARIDGRKFSKYTKGFNKPFDDRMSSSMEEVTKYLVDKTHADFGYMQSDEISLFWENNAPIENFMFSGRVVKIASILSGMASSCFMKQAVERGMPTDKIPHFDARVCQMPNTIELYNMLVWRQSDCVKNAVTSQAHSIFGHKVLHGKSDSERREMILNHLDQDSIENVIENRYLNGLSVFKQLYENGNGDVRSRIVPRGTQFIFSNFMKNLRDNFLEGVDNGPSPKYKDAFKLIKEGMKDE